MLQPRGPQSVSSRSALRKSLGLDRLPVKVNKQQATSTLELWVLYQQLKLTAADNAAKSSGQQLVEGTRHGHNVKAHQPHESTLSLVHYHSEAAGAQIQTWNGLPALQHLVLADSVTLMDDTHEPTPANLQPQHSGQQTREACSRADAL